jgi:hypothetical protein
MLTKRSKQFISIIIIACLAANTISAQVKQVLSPRNANYNMNVTLFPEKKMIDGQMELNWINTSHDTLFELQFHLYLNAFKNSESTFMRESGGSFRNDMAGSDKLSWGYIDILEMKTKKGTELTDKIQFIQPDDGNLYDQTVIRVPLNDTIMPGDTVNLEIKFESKLPKIFARTGYAGDYFFIGQWFPKIGVYEPAGMHGAKKGSWNCHQFHANSEFYADFGVYNVNITLPKDYVVGATGQLTEEKKSLSQKTLSFLAEDVIDFAWTASKRFVELSEDYNNVKIKLLIQPEHRDLAKRHFVSAKAAIDYFNKHLGNYPYPNLTIVDPPFVGLGSGGMEYPCLITAGSVAKLPNGIRMIEEVTMHEYGHQYFMGILASNEFEEAWMDEGINSYFETRIMDGSYGQKTSFIDFAGLKIGDTEMQRTGYIFNDYRNIAESSRFSWKFTHGGYGMFSYAKPATFINTLHNMVGNECMDDIWKTYYERYKFKHPYSSDFISVVNEIVPKHFPDKFGKDMNWYFDQVLNSSNICDYKILNITNKENEGPQGLFDKDGQKIYGDQVKNDTIKKYETKVVLKREGELILPVEVLIHFEDGQEITKEWDGAARTFEFIFLSDSKIAWAQIDPENKNLMDVNLTNNSMTLEPERNPVWKYAVKFLFWLQNIIQSVVWLA